MQQARRDALAWWVALLGPDFVCLTTLALDAVRYGGAITVARSPSAFVAGAKRRESLASVRPHVVMSVAHPARSSLMKFPFLCMVSCRHACIRNACK